MEVSESGTGMAMCGAYKPPVRCRHLLQWQQYAGNGNFSVGMGKEYVLILQRQWSVNVNVARDSEAIVTMIRMGSGFRTMHDSFRGEIVRIRSLCEGTIEYLYFRMLLQGEKSGSSQE